MKVGKLIELLMNEDLEQEVVFAADGFDNLFVYGGHENYDALIEAKQVEAEDELYSDFAEAKTTSSEDSEDAQDEYEDNLIYLEQHYSDMKIKPRLVIGLNADGLADEIELAVFENG